MKNLFPLFIIILFTISCSGNNGVPAEMYSSFLFSGEGEYWQAEFKHIDSHKEKGKDEDKLTLIHKSRRMNPDHVSYELKERDTTVTGTLTLTEGKGTTKIEGLGDLANGSRIRDHVKLKLRWNHNEETIRLEYKKALK